MHRHGFIHATLSPREPAPRADLMPLMLLHDRTWRLEAQRASLGHEVALHRGTRLGVQRRRARVLGRAGRRLRCWVDREGNIASELAVGAPA
jgi:hypothetical protein